MRAVLALVPQFRICSDDVLRARKLLCEWAAGEGYLNLLKWAYEHDYPLLALKDGRDACAAAAKGGHLAVQWLRKIRCRWDARTCRVAASGGHLEVLRWAHEHGCALGVDIMVMEGGHLAVLQWLRANDCAWDARVTRAAAEKGHFEVLEWALANGCELDPDAPFVGICSSGDLRVVQWALQQQISLPWGSASGAGLTLEVLRYLKQKRSNLAEKFVDLKKLATRQLASVGDLTGLQWARENGYFDPNEVCRGAAEGGQLEVLKWAHQNGLPLLNVRCEELAEAGHIECLKWVVANGKQPTCERATLSGRLSVLQWLRENGCEWDRDTLAEALGKGHWEVFEWARRHGYPADEHLCEEAAYDGYAEVLQWAFESAGGCISLDPEWCALAANPQVLKVLRDHGCERSANTCAKYTWRRSGDAAVGPAQRVRGMQGLVGQRGGATTCTCGNGRSSMAFQWTRRRSKSGTNSISTRSSFDGCSSTFIHSFICGIKLPKIRQKSMLKLVFIELFSSHSAFFRRMSPERKDSSGDCRSCTSPQRSEIIYQSAACSRRRKTTPGCA